MGRNRDVWLLIFVPFLNGSSLAMAASHGVDACQILHTLPSVKKLTPPTSQIIVVQSLGGIKANMTLCQARSGLWQPASPAVFRAVIGKNGMAVIGKKREGDAKTPAGLYPIGEAFGTEPLALKMDYKYITADDKFIDDVKHKHYNLWVSGPTDAQSYEAMAIAPYAFGAVIKYNMNPRKAGAGSAIFIHLWRSPSSATAGCIALDKQSLLTTLHWLDKSQHPYILIH